MGDTAASTELLAAAKDAAARNTDYYALLDLSPDDPLTRDSVQRAWRKRSLKYHPDKAGPSFDAAKWEEFGLARDVLASDEARAAYDAARSALLQKQRERDLMNAKQRRFAEELEKAEAESGSVSSRRAREQQEATNAEESKERERQAAEGRRHMEERKRKLREAEEREKERDRKEDEERDDRIRELEDQIAAKARRRAEKKAKREARKSGGLPVATDEDDVKKDTTRSTATTTTTTAATPPAPPQGENLGEQRRVVASSSSAPAVPKLEFAMSDDPIQFWATQWPQTKARLLAAQATKEQRLKAPQTTA